MPKIVRIRDRETDEVCEFCGTDELGDGKIVELDNDESFLVCDTCAEVISELERKGIIPKIIWEDDC